MAENKDETTELTVDKAEDKNEMTNEGTELALDAINEVLNNKEISIVCPRCGQKPEVIIEGKFHERKIARCSCLYVKTMLLGF